LEKFKKTRKTAQNIFNYKKFEIFTPDISSKIKELASGIKERKIKQFEVLTHLERICNHIGDFKKASEIVVDKTERNSFLHWCVLYHQPSVINF
jgi:hypothetical protein